MSDNSTAAVKMFLEGYNCAQAVVACCGRDYGLPRETAIQVAQAFGGGVGKTGNLCGAVTGALMVIGLKRSAKDGKDTAAKEEAHRLAREFLARFNARYGTLLCRELLGCDLSSPESKALHRTQCPKFVRDAVTILEELLNEPLEPKQEK